MSHLSLITGTTGTPDVPGPTDDEATADDRTATSTAPTGCCPISAAEEFSYRNPGVLGDSLVSASQRAVDAARRGDHEVTERMLAWLADRSADAHAYDDHASRHLIQGITLALYRAVTVAQHSEANHAQHTYEIGNYDHEDHKQYEEYDDGRHPSRHHHDTQPAPSGRVRVHRPRTPCR